METTELSIEQKAYKMAVDKWVHTIRKEEHLASKHPTTKQIDNWEVAHLKEEGARNNAITAKKDYEDAVRKSLFDF